MRHHWFIGDIHGCFEAYIRLESKLRQVSSRAGAEPHFVSVGDLVDRGPDSAAVVGWFRRGHDEGTHTAIPGNHEEMMIRCLYGAVPEAFEGIGVPWWCITGDLYRQASMRSVWLDPHGFDMLGRLMWLSQGGTPALESWGIDPHDPSSWHLPEEDLAFLCKMNVLFECETAVATHALITEEDLEILRDPGPVDAFLRDVVSGALWRRALPQGRPDPRPHVSGHTPMRRVRRYADRGMVRVDTGCFLGWRLSAWCPELDRVVSVPGEGL